MYILQFWWPNQTFEGFPNNLWPWIIVPIYKCVFCQQQQWRSLRHFTASVWWCSSMSTYATPQRLTQLLWMSERIIIITKFESSIPSFLLLFFALKISIVTSEWKEILLKMVQTERRTSQVFRYNNVSNSAPQKKCSVYRVPIILEWTKVRVYMTQCGNFIIFLSLRFYVKSIFGIL